MSTQKFKKFFGPVLKALNEQDSKTMKLRDMPVSVGTILELSEEQMQMRTPSGVQTVVYNRVSWSVQYMLRAGLVERVGRGEYRITDRGVIELEKHGNSFSLDDLENLEDNEQYSNWKYSSRQAEINDVDITESEEEPGEQLAPEDQVEQAYRKFRETIEDNLLEKVRSNSSEFLENLAKDLLLAMGYGDPSMARVTGGAYDKGIDAIISEDRLGLGKIYIQTKRYRADNKVTPDEIKVFESSVRLASSGSGKGVFVTTSDFTAEAKRTISQQDSIVLINGRDLARLMVDYNVGVRDLNPKPDYRIVRIDEEYFMNF